MNKQMGYAIAIVTGTAALIAVYQFFKDEVAAGAAAVGNAVDPTSDKNLAYKGVNAVGGALTGAKDFSLGGWLYDVTHPTPATPPFVPRANAVKAEATWYENLIGH